MNPRGAVGTICTVSEGELASRRREALGTRTRERYLGYMEEYEV